jgi:hypothetical protein
LKPNRLGLAAKPLEQVPLDPFGHRLADLDFRIFLPANADSALTAAMSAPAMPEKQRPAALSPRMRRENHVDWSFSHGSRPF